MVAFQTRWISSPPSGCAWLIKYWISTTLGECLSFIQEDKTGMPCLFGHLNRQSFQYQEKSKSLGQLMTIHPTSVAMKQMTWESH